MNIAQLLEGSGTNVTLAVNIADLREFAEVLFDKWQQQEAAAREQECTDGVLSVGEVCKILNVSRGTLWRWNKEGYLKPVKIGRKSFYKQKDIAGLIDVGPSTKKPVTGEITGRKGGAL